MTTYDLTYPIRIESGSLALSPAPTLAMHDHILQFLETMTRERKLLPFYGLPDMVFHRSISLKAIQAIILSSLARWFPSTRFNVYAKLGMRLGTISVQVFWEPIPGRVGTQNIIDFELEI